VTAGDAARLTASAGACCSESDDDELRSTSATVVNDSRASRGSVGAVSLLTCYVVAGRSGLVVSASDCDVRGPRFESRRRRFVFIATDAAIYIQPGARAVHLFCGA